MSAIWRQTLSPIFIAKTGRPAATVTLPGGSAGENDHVARSDIEGLDVFLPETDPKLERERQWTDLDNDLLQWKKATAAWQDDFVKKTVVSGPPKRSRKPKLSIKNSSGLCAASTRQTRKSLHGCARKAVLWPATASTL